MPRTVPQLFEEKKAIIVDIPTQAFGAYESGLLVRWGPVSSGDRRHQTPAGEYHLNWHARVHISTEDPTWVMPWCVKFSTGTGLALHQYALPGRPASHGCARMLAEDAKWLFSWGEGWTLAADTGELLQPGTLVLILGKYDYAAPPAWRRPEWSARGVTLPPEPMASRR